MQKAFEGVEVRLVTERALSGVPPPTRRASTRECLEGHLSDMGINGASTNPEILKGFRGYKRTKIVLTRESVA